MLQFKVSGIIFVVRSLLYLDFGEILLQFKMTLYFEMYIFSCDGKAEF